MVGIRKLYLGNLNTLRLSDLVSNISVFCFLQDDKGAKLSEDLYGDIRMPNVFADKNKLTHAEICRLLKHRFKSTMIPSLSYSVKYQAYCPFA